MTTAKPTATTPQSPDGFRFPDPPEHQPDDMTSFNHLTITGSAHYLLEHFGNRETTLVAGEHYVSREPVRSTAGLHYPDLLVAFGVGPGGLLPAQRVRHLRAGEATGLRTRDSLPGHRSEMTWETNGDTMRSWAYRSTGVSTRRGNSTAPGWPETDWWTTYTCRS